MDAFEFVGDWSGQLIATSIHAGHDLRPEIAELSILAEDDRFREEDPFTDRIASLAPARVLVHRSRFETDLNRVREKTVYRRPEDAWGLRMWSLDPLPDDVVARSLEVYDSFFAALAERLDEVAARGPFVLFDVHAYNHRRHGEEADAASAMLIMALGAEKGAEVTVSGDDADAVAEIAALIEQDLDAD